MKVPTGESTIESMQASIAALEDHQSTFQQTLNIVRYDTINLTFPGTPPFQTFVAKPHSLGYTPSYMAFLEWPDLTGGGGTTRTALPFIGLKQYIGSGVDATIWLTTDNTNVTAFLQQQSSQSPTIVTYTIKYYLFREPAVPTSG